MTSSAPVVALTAPGEMGAAIGGLLVAHGLEVRCNLERRSAPSVARAQRAGITAASDDQIARADIILSIVAPENALTVARHVAQIVSAAGSSPVFVDCNPLAPRTVADIEHLMTEHQITFVDCGILGLPPSAQPPSTVPPQVQPANAQPSSARQPSPRFCVSGRHSSKVTSLQRYGLDVKSIDGPIGAASALKLSYAGITKGLIAIGSAMFLAAHRAGVSEALAEEMTHSQSQLLASLSKSIPDMLGKAARWTAEMGEIAEFIGNSRAERTVYTAAAGLYDRLATLNDSDAATLKGLFPKRETSGHGRS